MANEWASGARRRSRAEFLANGCGEKHVGAKGHEVEEFGLVAFQHGGGKGTKGLAEFDSAIRQLGGSGSGSRDKAAKLLEWKRTSASTPNTLSPWQGRAILPATSKECRRNVGQSLYLRQMILAID